MSTYEDDFSECSMDESLASARDEPPTLDETLFDISVCFFPSFSPLLFIDSYIIAFFFLATAFFYVQ